MLGRSGPGLLGDKSAFALTGTKADERVTLLGMFEVERQHIAYWPGQTPAGDKNYFGADLERHLEELDVTGGR
ncbi:hypothetical protein [Streptomyces sp. NPDC055243]|uniref:hypothetical protein n=1 Tax=Streptomyces sp. NPDC055243 TaxID=3365720 RepID=UPI0037CF53FF